MIKRRRIASSRQRHIRYRSRYGSILPWISGEIRMFLTRRERASISTGESLQKDRGPEGQRGGSGWWRQDGSKDVNCLLFWTRDTYGWFILINVNTRRVIMWWSWVDVSSWREREWIVKRPREVVEGVEDASTHISTVSILSYRTDQSPSIPSFDQSQIHPTPFF